MQVSKYTAIALAIAAIGGCSGDKAGTAEGVNDTDATWSPAKLT